MTQLRTPYITNNAVTYQKIQIVSASSILGNPTGSSTIISEITLGSGLSFVGSTIVASINAINQLTGDVLTTAAVGSQSKAATINTNAVTYSKFQQVGAVSLLGNPTVSTANVSEITLGAGLAFSGTTLTATNTSSGTVTSVALADASTIPIYIITGSPITTAGTLTTTLTTQTSATFFAGPTTGAATQPTFRSIVTTDIPTLNQNTTGTASNITASSNSTLTTLSALSLPGSQVSGNIPGNAANITATSNSTLTTLSSLSLPTSQLSGIVALTDGGTGISTLTGVTGTGNIVASASPTLTGTIISTNNTMSGTLLVPTIDGLASGGALSIAGGAAASNGAGGAVTVAGASGSGVTSGGAGGNLNLNGGTANGDNTANQSGGAVTINGGQSKGSATGGTVTVTSGTGGIGTGTAGTTGGTTNINGGTGGAGSATSGNGGGFTGKAGSGGNGVAGGAGGTAQLVGGTGGTGSASGGNGGPANVQGGSPASFANSQGGSVTVAAGNGSNTGAGGAGGTVMISTGTAGGDNTQNNSGGSLTLSVGHSIGSSGGSNVTITAGVGGVGTSTTGANGGTTNINAGNGGVGSATGGTGGNVVISAGTGGNSGTPGVGGFIQFMPAATTSTSERFRITSTECFASNAQLEVKTAGFGLGITHGSNCKLGTSTLSGGTVTVSNTAITANSIIFLTIQSPGGTVGAVYISAKTAGTSFVITSSSAIDTSIVGWIIIEGL